MKQIDNITVIAPRLIAEQHYEEVSVLGSITWLWYQDAKRRIDTVKRMMNSVLPAIKAKTFIIFMQNSQLIGCCTYANFSAEMESLYYHGQLAYLREPDNWLSGDRQWVINWFAPFGHHWELRYIMRHYLFANTVGRSLKATRTPGEMKLLIHRGANVSLTEQRQWLATHPILSYQPNTQQEQP